MAWIQTILKVFDLTMLKIKMRNSRNRREIWIFYWLFFKEIKSNFALWQHACFRLSGNSMFAIWRKIAIQTFLRGIVGKWRIAEVECFCRYQTGRKNFWLGSNLVDKNWTSKLKLSSRAFAVAIIFQVYVRWKINVVEFNVWINWIQFRNPFLP